MKVLIPMLGFAPTGGFRVLSRLATEWHHAGHTVTIIVPVGTPPPYHPTEAAICWAGLLTATTSDRPDTPSRRWQGARNLVSLWNGTRRLADRYDVVLANHSLTALPVFAAGARRSSRFYYIQADETDYYREAHAPVKAALARLSYRLPFRQIVNSPLYLDHSRMHATAVVPPGVDAAIFYPRARRDFADEQPIVIGAIGRSEPIKGTRYVLDAFVELAAGDSRFRLKVAYGNLPVGWAHPRANVVVPRNDADLADYYRSVDILVAPGTGQHGAPHYPVMEAMACGVPVVTTGYLPADERNSWLVANRDAPAIAAACRTIVDDPNYSDRVERASDAIAAFAWPTIAARMMAVFSDGRA